MSLALIYANYREAISIKAKLVFALLIAATLLSSGCIYGEETDWWDEHRAEVRQALKACMMEGDEIERDTERSTCEARCDFWDECAKPKHERFLRDGCLAEECQGLTESACQQKCEEYTTKQMGVEYECPWWWNEHPYITGGECVNLGI